MDAFESTKIDVQEVNGGVRVHGFKDVDQAERFCSVAAQTNLPISRTLLDVNILGDSSADLHTAVRKILNPE